MSDNNWDTDVRPVHAGRAQPDLRPDRQRLTRSTRPRTPRSPDPTSRQPAEQRRRRHDLRRPRPGLRRLLRQQPHRPTQPARRRDRQEHRRPAERQERHLGLVPGRLRADRDRHGRLAVCGATHANIGGDSSRRLLAAPQPVRVLQVDREPASTCRRPRVAAIGHTDQANHQYDLSDFDAALKARQPARGELPEGAGVPGRPPGLLRPARRADSSSSTRSTRSRSRKYWKSTAIVITYDDSDGWYDHLAPRDRNGSNQRRWTPRSARSGAGAAGGYQDRCGYGQRLPLLVISPYPDELRQPPR